MNIRGLSIRHAGRVGLVIDYDMADDTYTLQDGSRVAREECIKEASVEDAVDIAKYWRANANRDERVVLTEDGWDVVSALSEYDNEDERVDGTQEQMLNLHKNNRPGELTDTGHIWDPNSQTMIQGTGEEQPLRSQIPGFDPATNTLKPQNPEIAFAEARTQQYPNGPFPERSEKRNLVKTDDSYPSGTLSSSIDAMTQSEYTSYLAANLEDCPECNGKMTNHSDEAICHDCGHRQPVHYARTSDANPHQLKPGDPSTYGPDYVPQDPGVNSVPFYENPVGIAAGGLVGGGAGLAAGAGAGADAVAPIVGDLASTTTDAAAPVADSVATTGQAAIEQAGNAVQDIAAPAESAAKSAGGWASRWLNRAGLAGNVLWGAGQAANAVKGLLGGGNTQGQPAGGEAQLDAGMQSTGAVDDKNKNIGIGVDIMGVDSFPDAGNKGFTDDVGDTPDVLKDVDGVGGTTDPRGLSPEHAEILSDMLPRLVAYAIDDKSHSDDPVVEELNTLFSNIFGEDEGEEREEEPDKDKKSSHVVWNIITASGVEKVSVGMNAPVGSCIKCGQNTTGLMQCPVGDPSCPSGLTTNATSAPMSEQGQIHPNQTVFASTEHESVRRPKMCPYHDQLVEWVQGIGDTSLAFTMMAPHLYSDRSCKGGWQDETGSSKCKFKSEMATPQYWAQKEADAEQRKQERELRRQQEQEMLMQQPQEQAVEAADPQAITQDIPDAGAVHTDSDYVPSEPWSGDMGGTVTQMPAAAPAAPMAMAARTSETMTPERHHEHPNADQADDPTSDFYNEKEYGGEDDGEASAKDADGNPIEAGATYELVNSRLDDAIPDIVEVVSVKPMYIEIKVKNDEYNFEFTDKISTEQIENEGLSFTRIDGDGDPHPNALGEASTRDDASHSEDPSSIDDLDRGGNSLSNPLSSMQHEAGRAYSPIEQRGFVEESGTARNIHKLDLSNTHYEYGEGEVTDDNFLW